MPFLLKLYFIVLLSIYAVLSQQIIDISKPYSSGSLSLSNPNNFSHIRFSNNIGLRVDKNSVGGVDDIPQSYLYITIVDSTCSVHGFKQNDNLQVDTIKWDNLGSHYLTITTKNADTVWSKATSFPKKLAYLDIVKIIPNAQKSCKIFATGMESDETIFWESSQNYNSIFYLKGADGRKIVCQLYDARIIKGEDSNEFKSIRFRWAADSSGNGLFKKGTPISTYRQIYNSQKISLKNIKKGLFLLPSFLHSKTQVTLFTVRGKRVLQFMNLRNKVINLSSLKKGIYIAQIKSPTESIKLTLRI